MAAMSKSITGGTSFVTFVGAVRRGNDFLLRFLGLDTAVALTSGFDGKGEGRFLVGVLALACLGGMVVALNQSVTS